MPSNIHERTQQDCKPAELSLNEVAGRVLDGESLDREDARALMAVGRDRLLLLFYHADRIRRQFRPESVRLCSIINAKSGACPEDCSFCAQSAHHGGESVPVYPLVDETAIRKATEKAIEDGASGLGVVISGDCIADKAELEKVGGALRIIGDSGQIEAHGSLGMLNEEQLRYLKRQGLTCFNHNLETAEGFFPNVCTTHRYEDRMETVRAAKRVGLRVCCGGIFGLGESEEHRIDLALTLRDLDVDVVPMNFLHPIPDTPLADREPMRPLEILKTIAVYRFLLPNVELKIAGGREKNLRDLQSMLFFAGADSMLVGGYLTTPGCAAEMDLTMLDDLEIPYDGASRDRTETST